MKTTMLILALVALASCAGPTRFYTQKVIYRNGTFYTVGERLPVIVSEGEEIPLIFSSKKIKLKKTSTR